MYFDQLIMKVDNIHLEVVEGPHLNEEEVMFALLELLVGRVLSEEQLCGIFEVID